MEIFTAVGSLEALAHATRLGVMRLLTRSGRAGLSAGDISRHLDLPPNSLSFHLGRLVNAGLIGYRRSGRNLFYAADYARVAELVSFLADDCCADAPDGCLPACPAVSRAPFLDTERAGGGPDRNISRRK